MLAEALRHRQARCVAIHSSPGMPDDMKSHFDPGLFAAVIDHRGDIDDTARALAGEQPSHVIAGFESGVLLADQLSDRLSLPANAAASSEVRRDKYLMWEAVRRRGLQAAHHTRSPHVEDIVQWSRTNGWPIVVKPASSVASDMVACCSDEAAVRHAAERVLSQPNVLGDGNDAVVAQQFLDGPEYVVDTVSVDGRPKVTAYWEYSRVRHPDGRLGYDAMTLLPYEGPRQAALRAYALEVLEALDISFGPAHSELVWSNGAPHLIEVGARLSAGVNAMLSGLCGGLSQLDETVAAILDPQSFLRSLSHRPTLRRRAANVFLIPARQGRLKRVRHLDAIAALPTVHSYRLQTTPGEILRPVAGRVTLVADDLSAIRRDIATIRRLEQSGLFDVETRAPLDPRSSGATDH
jgi:biotin carboxylase